MTDYEHGTGNNIAMTSLNVPLALQNAYLFELKPDLKAVALLYNKNHKQVVATEVVPMRAALRKLGLTVVDVAVSAQDTSAVELHEQMPRALRELREADPGLRNSIFWLTSSTAVFSQLSTVVKLADSVPVVSGIPNAVRPGEESAVLSVGIDRRSNARLAAIYASRILRGEVRPGELKLGVVTPPDIAINFGVANRLDLRMPFRFLESASFVYGYDYEPLRSFGRNVVARR
ncbi:MAG: hypothetical protein KDK91_16105, partial [Gammaproteobacteria bacterium]|nr:hypothetical protein [Gammaproteobacteria bacterium]